MLLRTFTFLIALCLLPAWVAAREMTVFLVTIGPGEIVYERFGHNALLFLDAETGQSAAYDWGRFDFDQPGFIARFIRGEMLYSSGEADGETVLAFYKSIGRGVALQKLNLSPEQTQTLLQICQTGSLPENRDYRYDYFTANCSTQLRDALDESLDGIIEKQLTGVATGTTYRRETERHMAPDALMWFSMHAGFGASADEPIDAWEQCFLPGELSRWLGEVELTRDDGERVPVGVPVEEMVVLSQGTLPPIAAERPSRWGWTGLIGLAVGGAMVLLTLLPRLIFARLAASAWYLMAGLAGTLGMFLWLLTGHEAGYANQSILLSTPLGLPLALMVLVPKWRRWTQRLTVAHLALCVVGAVMHLIPGIGQENAAAVALALPINVAAAWVVVLLSRRHRKPDGQHSADPDMPFLPEIHAVR